MTLVRTEIQNGVATFTMDDGRANIMNGALLTALIAAFERAARDQAAVVLRSGLANTYSGGFDIKVLAAGDRDRVTEMVRAGGELVHTMLTFPRPILAVADGHVFPMGLLTLLAADYRIATNRDFGWGLNEAEIGIVPPLYAFRLLEYRLDGAWLSRALTTADRYTPGEGLEAGVFDEIVAPDGCDRVVAARAARLAGFAPEAFRGIKQRLRGAVAAAVRAALDEALNPSA